MSEMEQTKFAWNDLMINFGQPDYRKEQFQIDLRVLIRSVMGDVKNSQAKGFADFSGEMNQEPFKRQLAGEKTEGEK